MAADVGEAVLLRHGGDTAHHHPLHAAQVHHDGALGDEGRVALHPFDGGSGTDGDEQDVALGDVLLRQRGVDGAAHPGQGHGLMV